MNTKKIDTAEANDQSSYNDKFMDVLMSKEVVLPAIGVILVLIAIWAFMTKCGRRKCCKSSRSEKAEEKYRVDGPKRAVRAERSETAADLECGTNATRVNSDGASS